MADGNENGRASSQKAFTVTFIRLIVKIQLYSLIQQGIYKAMTLGIVSCTNKAKARDEGKTVRT